MCYFRAVVFQGCNHTLYHVKTRGTCYRPLSGFECSLTGMFAWIPLGYIEEIEVVRLRCASCVFGTPFPAPAVVTTLLPNQFLAASPAVQHMWFDREVRPYLRDSDRAPKFDWHAASVEDCCAATEWEYQNGY